MEVIKSLVREIQTQLSQDLDLDFQTCQSYAWFDEDAGIIAHDASGNLIPLSISDQINKGAILLLSGERISFSKARQGACQALLNATIKLDLICWLNRDLQQIDLLAQTLVAFLSGFKPSLIIGPLWSNVRIEVLSLALDTREILEGYLSGEKQLSTYPKSLRAVEISFNLSFVFDSCKTPKNPCYGLP